MKRQIGLVLLCVGFIFGCVNAENKQEIGEPYFSAYDARRNIALTQDGKKFYVVGKKGMVIRYQLSPLKKLDSFQMPETTYPFNKYAPSTIFLTEDEKRLIFYSVKGIMLFDINAQKILKQIKFENFSSGVVVDGERVISLFAGESKNKSLISDWSGKVAPCTTELRVFDNESLSVKRVISYDEASFCGKRWHFDQNKRLFIKVGRYIIYGLVPNSSGFPSPSTEKDPRLVIFDIKTLKPKFITSFSDNSNFGSSLRLSHDFSTLYVLNAIPYTGNEPYQGKAFSGHNYQTTSSINTIAIDLNMLQVNVMKDDWNKVVQTTVALPVDDKIRAYFSESRDYVSRSNLLNYTEHVEETAFYLFSNGEAVFQNIKTKKLKMTKSARKYVKMKNSAGEIVPMNDATFKEYYSEIN